MIVCQKNYFFRKGNMRNGLILKGEIREEPILKHIR